MHMAGSTVHDRLNALYIGLPHSVRSSVGMGNLNAEGNALAANIALGHFAAPPILEKSLVNPGGHA